MAVPIISADDLTPFAQIDPAKAEAMIDDALAMAARVAPCMADDTFTLVAAARAILRGAILRWHEAGTGAMSATQVQAGSFGQSQSYDTRQQRRGMFWPSEIEQLQELCQGDVVSGAYSIDTATCEGSVHLPWCSLYFGATFCSCGVDIAGSPIYENWP